MRQEFFVFFLLKLNPKKGKLQLENNILYKVYQNYQSSINVKVNYNV